MSALRAAVLSLALGTLGLTTFAAPARAWWAGYVWGYRGYPLYVAPPPVVYAPPPVYYPPPGYYVPVGRACYAGAYICQLPGPVPAGSSCSCPVSGGYAVGQVR